MKSLLLFHCFLIPAFILAQTTQYTYDNLHRLTNAHYSNGASIQYSYDANGNRISEVRTTGTSRHIQAKMIVKQSGLKADGFVSLYPNPVRNILSIKGLPAGKEKYSITITNSSGATVRQWQKTSVRQINVSDLPAGAYLLMIDDKVYRFVKE